MIGFSTLQAIGKKLNILVHTVGGMMFFLFKRKKIKTPEDLAKNCKTPEGLNSWMWWHIKYISDWEHHKKAEFFQPPDMTLRVKAGDCDDYAWLAYATLEHFGVQDKHLISVTDDNRQRHMVCAYYWKGDWFHISNWGNTYCKKARLLKDVPPYVYKNWIRWVKWIPLENTLKAVKAHYPGVEL